MRHTRLLALIAAALGGLLLLAVAVAETPTVPPLSTSSATAVPGTPTATPAPIVVDGRVCASGRLINGFLVLAKDDRDPGCVVTSQPARATTLYALQPYPASLSFGGIAQSPDGSIISVQYRVASGQWAGEVAVDIQLNQNIARPPVLSLLTYDQATPARYLPAPGVQVRPTGELDAYWYDADGLYSITIYSSFTDLTLEQVAALLGRIPNPLIPAGPPSVGTGPATPGSGGGFLLAAVALSALAGGATAGAWHRRHTLRNRRP